MQLTNGTLLQGGKYRLESVLGQGAYGITYLAMATMKGDLGNIAVKVAIKEFFSKELNSRRPNGMVAEASSDSLAGKYSNMFLREAKNLSHLEHDGIVNVLEAFSENNTHYYVMEYVDGGSLDAYIRSKGRLSERETLSLARQIGSALAFMHENKMLHLDLKPKNIMLRADGTLCLIDFGLSKQYEADGEPESSTTIGLGTPGYAPIEQGSSDDRKTFAPTLDIYAFGATLFKMLTGKTPPRSSDIFNEGFPEEALLSLEISEETISAIRHAMSPRKGDRPQTVEEFLKELVEDRDDIDVGCWDVKETHDDGSEDTELTDDATPLEEDPSEEKSNEVPDSEPGKTPAKSLNKRLLYGVAGGLLAAVAAVLCILWGVSSSEKRETGYSNGILKVNGIEYPMVYVPGGSFMMGSEDNDAHSYEKPIHRVTLSSYYIGKYEVTQDLWEAVMGSNPSYFKGNRKPVEQVSWNNCKEFVRKLNSLTGQNFRLPTEAQWEFAARGGNSSYGYKYSGSDDIDNVAWHDSNSKDRTHNVGTKSPNELGIYDMSGNVYEWCNDWSDTDSGGYGSSPVTNPSGPSSGRCRMYRGGSWDTSAWSCRVSYRFAFTPDFRTKTLGLRLCL